MKGWLCAALLLAGCTAGKSDGGAWDTAISDGDTTIDSDDTGFDTGGVAPAWWRLSASIVIEEQAARAKVSRVSVDLLTSELDVLCGAAAPVDSIESQASPDEVIFAWWSVTVGSWSGTCPSQDVDMPELGQLELGIGQMHPEILAVIDSVVDAEDGAESTLNGAYATYDGSDRQLAFGVAGPAAAYSGDGKAADSAPLDDGTWLVTPVYLFKLESR